MTEQNPNPVVVGVGHEPIEAAIAYAVQEAGRAGCGLHLVHAVHVVPSGPEMMLVDVTDVERIGRQTLDEALEHARDVAPGGMVVTGALVLGTAVPSLVEAGEDARMIVLQHRDLTRMMRVVTRSVSSGVAAHAKVPVVSVPSYWSTDRQAQAEHTVSVGVDIPDRSQEILRVAADAARTRGASLHVLHTWSFPSAYDDIIMSRVEHDEWGARATAEIQQVLDGLGDAMTGVAVTIEARHAQPADALIEASKDSELLVVGRHDPLVPFGSHLGPIARAVLREAECPVLLANPRTGHRWGGRSAEKHPEVQHS
jgi:nucleotide-binding universal stress UspA family protein